MYTLQVSGVIGSMVVIRWHFQQPKRCTNLWIYITDMCMLCSSHIQLWIHWALPYGSTAITTMFFTTIATNLAIWMANLLLSIRVQTMLLTSMFHALPFSARALKKHFLSHSYCGKKKNKSKFAVDSLSCASWVHNIFTTVMTRARCRYEYKQR